MAINIYLDESGDLGWSFTSPFRNGGSSRYLTIAFIICPPDKKHFPKRLVKSIYTKFGADPKKELKGSSLDVSQKKIVAQEVVKLHEKHPDIEICSITVKKENVKQHIREDSNKLYNYMIRRALLDKIQMHDLASLIRDNRGVKIKSGNSLIDYLQIYLYFEIGTQTKIKDIPSDSKQVKNLILADWINNLIWAKYEDENSDAYNILDPILREGNLYF